MKRKVLIVLTVSMLFLGSVITATVDGQLIIWADDTRTPIFKELADDYTEMTGIVVTVYEMTMDAITEQVVTASPAGEGPDLIVGAHDWIGRLVRNGTIAAIDLPEDLLLQFDPVTIDAMSFEGGTFGDRLHHLHSCNIVLHSIRTDLTSAVLRPPKRPFLSR